MSNIDIAKQSFLAYVNSDRESNEAVIAREFRFTSPLDNQIDRATYFDRCWPNNEAITAFKFIRLVEDDGEVIVTYEGKVKSGRTFRNTEILTVKDGKIQQVEVYFGWDVPHRAPKGGFVTET